ncbi:MAG: ABC transporter ATP-binding protein [Pseudomonadota bacterium]
MSAHVAVDGLTITFGEPGQQRAAVDDVTLKITQGATFGIVGESGSGKSTLARALLGHTRPGARVARGHVDLGGTDVFALHGKALRTFRGRSAAMVPQNPLSSLTPHCTIRQQLLELITLHTPLRGEAALRRVRELMDRTGLPDPAALQRRYPHELSGGQRQRVVIASVLVAKPSLIVLDEPTTALDKTVEARVLALVTEVAAEIGATLVYVSHDLNVVGAICEHVAVMKDGRLVEEGKTRAIFADPRAPYTRRLVEAIPILKAAPPPPTGHPPQTVLAAEAVTFQYRRRGVFKRGGPAVLNNVSFQLCVGETLGLVGESGSGKSTLASLIAGAVSGHSGTIRLQDAVLAGPARQRARALRRRVQMVFQDPLSSLNPAQTVGEIVGRPARLYFGDTAAQAHKKSVALLAELDLPAELLTRRPRELSGGQQQRVAVARALAADPDVLICDEVTSALDVTVQASLIALLKRLQRERGIACLFISHDLAVVSDIAHRIMVLERGEVRDYGPRDQVIASPETAYTKMLLDAFRATQALRQERAREALAS